MASVSLLSIDAKLKSGQCYTFKGNYESGTPYAFVLSYDGKGYTLMQNGLAYYFRSLEVALCTILSCLGGLEPSH